ncbi:Uncharacterised protein [Vibrio cholerae]|nr:Uncharacterised protein [Vibrio cholerae]CSI38002.1 Uncharacterised protein [Vibrio cholerae]CSI65923.1 Uncharacterised protein [Vibrio cholerae]
MVQHQLTLANMALKERGLTRRFYPYLTLH